MQEKKPYSVALKLFLGIICFLLIFGLTVTPQRYGDGMEYMLMTQAFQDHFSPNITNQDYQNASAEFNYEIPPKLGGIFESNSGNWYSYHFWLYSLLVMPSKVIIKLLNGNQLSAYYLTNAVLYLLAIYYAYRKLKADDKTKLVWVLLFGFNPAIFYVSWTHPEVFTYSLTCISLAMFYNKEYRKAIITLSVASTQNQPIIFLGILYFIEYCLQLFSKKNRQANFELKEISTRFIKPFILTGLCFSPALIPPLFYFISFGKLSLLPFQYSSDAISKISSLFFDLNFGMIVFIPLILILFLVALAHSFTRNAKGLLYIATVFLICFICSFQVNWNSDASGLNRYAVWIQPVLIYYCIAEVDLFRKDILKKVFRYGLYASCAVSTFIIFFCGIFSYRYPYTYFNPVAKIVLNYAPSLYNPQHEVFYEKCAHEEDYNENNFPVIYSNNGYVKKVLLNNSHIEKLKLYIETEDFSKVEEKLKPEQAGLYYLSFDANNVRLRGYSKGFIIDDSQSSFVLSKVELPTQVRTGEEFKITFVFTNTSDHILIGGDNPIGVSYHWYNMNGEPVVFDNPRYYFTSPVLPNEAKIISMTAKAPDAIGQYNLMINCVQENVKWFMQYPSSPYIYTINVTG